jgi:cytochrome c-type biogenesis protein CcmF
MTVELGHFALILALCVALVQGVVPMIGAARRYVRWMDFASSAAVAQFLLVSVSFGCLMHAHVVSDFSVLNVALNSHSAKPMLFKVAGTWGNHEGSMLLWVLILSLFGAAVAAFGGNLPAALRARALAVQAWIAVGFYLFIVVTSNPFVRINPTPADGQGLNPLLPDPGLALHPPMLYLGYVGFSMAFSFAIAALIEGRVDAAWARWVRPWTLAAWIFLTGGIALGAGWAYYELGWGGWWFWDPVENASLMPWLAGTALLHSAIVVEKRDTLKAWTVFLAIVTFSLSLLGTFLVRSGILTSVHAFAVDPQRGVFILALMVIVVGGSLILFAWRGPTLRSSAQFKPVSREGALLLNNLLLSSAAATVLLGTLYPLILDAVDGSKVSVGPPFFNATFVPLMGPLLVLMAIGPLLPWKRGDLPWALRQLAVAGIAAATVTGFSLVVYHPRDLLGSLGLALAAWLIVGTLSEFAERLRLFRAPASESLRRLARLPRAALGMTLAHAGLGVAVAGMTVSSVWKQEVITTMVPGASSAIGSELVTFNGVERISGPNYVASRANLTIVTPGGTPRTLFPERRQYPVEGSQTTEAAIASGFFGDIYVAIGEQQPDGAFVVRLYYNPLVTWIWGGIGMMVLGGVASLSDRRFRVAAPARRRIETAPVGAEA